MPLHKHLRRLDQVWLTHPIFFITTNTASRRPILANKDVVEILRDEFERAADRYGWRVGRYVVMPDHLHFFCAGEEGPEVKSLSSFVGGFKQWSAKRIAKATGVQPPIWQPEFFDHVLRSSERYEDKWRYVVANPVNAGLVARAEDWPFAGEIFSL